MNLRYWETMTTYVLVHGAWSGAHGFRLVRPMLRDAGHEVTTPSLTGIGERVHLTGPHVNLSTHVRDVVNHVLYEDLTDIVLLGFSYGGMVVTGALEHIADRIRHLVYLDAFVPEDGQSLFAMTGRPTVPIGVGDSWLVPSAPRDFDDPVEAAFAVPRRVEHPISCFTEPVRLAQPLDSYSFTRTYIRATADPADAAGSSVFAKTAERLRNSATWRYREVATNHMIPSNRPRELADLLLELAE
jgi:pimeloyl-ACP methyl ester carboxylesterase